MECDKLSEVSQEVIWNFKTDSLRKVLSCCAIKDFKSTFLDISESTALLLGWKKAKLAIGKTEYNIPCKAVDWAEVHCKADQEVIARNKKLTAIYIGNYSTGWSILLAEKIPIKLNNTMERGVFVTSIDISVAFPGLFNLFKSDSKILNSLKHPGYTLNETQNSLSLTARQQECLFLLVRGKTTKQIANILNITPRTVEDHIVKIKQNWHCHSKFQLIEKAIDNGFLHCLPQVFFNSFLDKITG